MTESEQDRPANVLFVCTANMCRSPMGEWIFRSAVRARGGTAAAQRWRVRSAGTHVIPATSTDPLVVEVLAEIGVPAAAAPTHQVRTEDLQYADLVLTATRAQRAWVVERLPAGVRRTFTLRQFARLCRAGRVALGPERAGQPVPLLQLADLGRGLLQPVPAEVEDLADPVGQGLDAFRSSRDAITSAVDSILGPTSSWPGR